MSAGPWRWTIYRSVLRRSRSVAVITCCTVDRESRNSRVIATGSGPAWKAARIGRSCPGVTGAALFAALDSADAGFGGSGLSTRCPGSGEWLGRSSPRLRASSTTALSSRSSCTSSSRRNERSKSVGRARPGTCRWIPPLPGLRFSAFASWPSPCPPAAADPRKPSPLPVRPSIRISVIRGKSSV